MIDNLVDSPDFGLAQMAANTGWFISGTTRIYAHLAHPSAHVRTPQLLNSVFAARGIDAAAVSFDVAPEDLPRLVDGLRGWRNLAGIGVTMPHKETVASLLDSVSQRANDIGAVNVISRDADGRLHGDNLDGLGFVTGFLHGGYELEGRPALLIGAGGAGRAIAFALADAGVSRLGVANRDRERAESLVTDVRVAYPGIPSVVETPVGGEYQVIVNATSLGMKAGDPMPVDIATIALGATVAEVVMTPAVTPWLEAAALAGISTHPGLPMLSAQIELVLEYLGLDIHQTTGSK
jgi:shikimate dehydrogenase